MRMSSRRGMPEPDGKVGLDPAYAPLSDTIQILIYKKQNLSACHNR